MQLPREVVPPCAREQHARDAENEAHHGVAEGELPRAQPSARLTDALVPRPGLGRPLGLWVFARHRTPTCGKGARRPCCP